MTRLNESKLMKMFYCLAFIHVSSLIGLMEITSAEPAVISATSIILACIMLATFIGMGIVHKKIRKLWG